MSVNDDIEQIIADVEHFHGELLDLRARLESQKQVGKDAAMAVARTSHDLWRSGSLSGPVAVGAAALGGLFGLAVNEMANRAHRPAIDAASEAMESITKQYRKQLKEKINKLKRAIPSNQLLLDQVSVERASEQLKQTFRFMLAMQTLEEAKKQLKDWDTEWAEQIRPENNPRLIIHAGRKLMGLIMASPNQACLEPALAMSDTGLLILDARASAIAHKEGIFGFGTDDKDATEQHFVRLGSLRAHGAWKSWLALLMRKPPELAGQSIPSGVREGYHLIPWLVGSLILLGFAPYLGAWLPTVLHWTVGVAFLGLAFLIAQDGEIGAGLGIVLATGLIWWLLPSILSAIALGGLYSLAAIVSTRLLNPEPRQWMVGIVTVTAAVLGFLVG